MTTLERLYTSYFYNKKDNLPRTFIISRQNQGKDTLPKKDNLIQLLSKLCKRRRKHLMLYEVNLMHYSQKISLDERSTYKRTKVDSTDKTDS